MGQVDLHLHTTASDGKHAPAELVRLAVGRGLTVMAITDHDTVNGVAAGLDEAKKHLTLRLIPAVELSTDVGKGEIHVLGYFVDHTDTAFEARLKDMRDSRIERARMMVEKLGKLGIRIEWERVKQIAGDGALGRPHVAQAMLEKGYIRNMQEAFSGYIGHGGPAYVERDKLTPADAVRLILGANGLPVLAHPLTSGDAEATMVELKAAGLTGVEVYYASYSDEEITSLLGLAVKHGLIATGGTDYHGIDATRETMPGGNDVPMKAANDLIALAKERGLRAVSA